MKFTLTRQRLHEPVALGALIALGITMNATWILNVVAVRVPAVAEVLALDPSVGYVTGLYVTAVAVYLLSWASVALLLRGRDCSAYRDRAFWFVVVSLLLYLVFTFPPVFQFAVGGA